MKHVRTCPLCEALCGLEIDHDGRTVQSIRGHAGDVLSRGHVCPKAVALKDVHEDPDRLRGPVRRQGDRWVEVSWDAALDEVAERLHAVQRDHGRHAVGVYLGNPNAHNYASLLVGPLVLKALRTHSRFSATSADQLPHMFASLHMFGHQLMLPVPDLDRTDLLVILGGNPVVSNGSVMTAPGMARRLKDIRARGGRVVVVDPRRTETAALADEHHAIRPGTDALLLAATIHALFDEDRVRLGRHGAFTDGLDRLREAVAPLSPERVAPVVGVGAEAIRDLARALATTPRAAVYGRLGMTTQRFGGLAAWLLLALNAVTNHLDTPGGMMFTRPAADLVEAAARAGQRGSWDRWRSRVSDLPEFGGELPVAALAEEIDTPGDGRIRAMVTVAGNPVLSTPNGGRLARALESLDFMVSLDPWINATTRHADLILPPVSPLERDHYGLAFHALAVRNAAKYSPRLFAPPPGARDDWEILLDIAERLHRRRGERLAAARTRAVRAVGPRRVLDALLRLGPEGFLRRPLGRRLSVSRLERTPGGVDLGPLEPCLPDRLYTADGRLDVAPEALLRDLPRLEAALEEDPDGEALVLVGRRHLRSNNSWLHNSHRLVKGPVRCTLLVHPEDAATRGLEDGARVVVRSRTGSVRALLELDEGMRPGVVSLPHGWGHRDKGARLAVANETEGPSANDLTDERWIDALTGTAALNGVPVEVAPDDRSPLA